MQQAAKTVSSKHRELLRVHGHRRQWPTARRHEVQASVRAMAVAMSLVVAAT
jgi:hypothetical protein